MLRIAYNSENPITTDAEMWYCLGKIQSDLEALATVLYAMADQDTRCANIFDLVSDVLQYDYETLSAVMERMPTRQADE